MLLPINGGRDRMAPLRSYNPSAALVDWAAEQYNVNALHDSVLGQFIDYYLEHNRLPFDIEAAYRKWIRIEGRNADRDAARTGRGLGAPEDAAEVASREAAFADAMQRRARQ
jgi:hypothetical protein